MDNLIQAKYISPSGLEVLLEWQEVSRAVSHAVAVGDYPQFDGGDVIDLGHTIEEYPLVCRFAGSDYQAKSDQFFQALKELGSGVLEHPRWGALSVIAKSAKQQESYVKGIGLSVVDVTFVVTGEQIIIRIDADGVQRYEHERLTPSMLSNDPQLITENNQSAQKALEKYIQVHAPSPSVFAKFNKAVLAPLQAINSILAKGWRLAGEWQSAFGTLEVAMNGILNVPHQVVHMVGAFLSPLKGMAKGERMQFFATIPNVMIVPQKDTYTVESPEAKEARISGTLVSQTMLTLHALELAVETNNDLSSREEASQLLDDIQALEIAYNRANQELFEEITILSPSMSVELEQHILQNFSITKEIIIARISTLKLKMSRTLRHSMSLLEVAFFLYGTVEDEQISELITLNNLSDEEIFLLDEGKEITYYG